MFRALFPCVLLLTACSAEVSVETEPFDQAVPVTSLLEDVYAEVAIDVPNEAVGDVIIREISASLTVVNPTKSLTLEVEARLSLEGSAKPDQPVLYTKNNVPAYFNSATLLLLTKPPLNPGATLPANITGDVLVKAAGKPRIWIIVKNTVQRVNISTDTFPANILLKDIIFRATVTKPFKGVGGALEVGGL
jgi:hypothetical protein